MNLSNNLCILIAVSMATNLFEVPAKYFDILTWNLIYFIQKMFSFKFCMKYVGFFYYSFKYLARECVTMVTNHTVTVKRNRHKL